MLKDLMDRHGEGAIVGVGPRMLESGETYRWEIEIDGTTVPGVFAHERNLPEDPKGNWRVLLMTDGNSEVELARWSTKSKPFAPYGPAAVTRRFGDLR